MLINTWSTAKRSDHHRLNYAYWPYANLQVWLPCSKPLMPRKKGLRVVQVNTRSGRTFGSAFIFQELPDLQWRTDRTIGVPTPRRGGDCEEGCRRREGWNEEWETTRRTFRSEEECPDECRPTRRRNTRGIGSVRAVASGHRLSYGSLRARRQRQARLKIQAHSHYKQ